MLCWCCSPARSRYWLTVNTAMVGQKTAMDKQAYLMDKSLEQTKKSSDAAIISAETAKSGLEIAQRAYLAVRAPECSMGGLVMVRLPIENYGHVPCRWLKLSFSYRRVTRPVPTADDKGHAAVKGRIEDLTLIEQSINIEESVVIAPGPGAHNILVALPTLSPIDRGAVESGNQSILISGTLEYDTGFNGSALASFFSRYAPNIKTWVNEGGTYTTIQLNESRPPQHANKPNQPVTPEPF
jgi:hypothetical protein